MDPEFDTVNDRFNTETDAAYVRKASVKAVIVIFVFLSLLACLGFLIAWQTFVFFECIVVAACLFTFINKIRNLHYYKLQFDGAHLLITDVKNSKEYEVFDVPQSDFIINQTKKEETIDYCSLTIKNTVFLFGGVKKCRELKEYIEQHFG